jgi:hypothetical protein
VGLKDITYSGHESPIVLKTGSYFLVLYFILFRGIAKILCLGMSRE